MAKNSDSTRSSSSSAPRGLGAPKSTVETARFTDEIFTSAKALHTKMRNIYDGLGTNPNYNDIESAAKALKASYSNFDDRVWNTSTSFRDEVKATGDKSGIKEFTSERERHEEYAIKTYNNVVTELYSHATRLGKIEDLKKIIKKI